MRRIATKSAGWVLLFLGIAVFLLERPFRKSDYARTLETVVQEAAVQHPEWTDVQEFARIEAVAGRLVAQSRTTDRQYGQLRDFSAGILFLAGLLLIQVGSWVSCREQTVPR